MNVRPARAEDARRLLEMMRDLARFEGYIDKFALTLHELLARAFDNPQCFILVAEQGAHDLAGYAVYLVTPFTYDLRPTVTLKELYVDPQHRGQGAGGALFTALRDAAARIGAGKIQWLVLPQNETAKRLYRSFGGERDRQWEHWRLDQ